MSRFATLPSVAAAAALALGAAACESDFSDRLISLEGTGSVEALLYMDNNLNSTFNPQFDSPVPLAKLILRRTGTRVGFIDNDTNDAGIVFFGLLGVGRYRIDLGPAVLGDSLERIDPNLEFTVPFRDTLTVPIGVRFKQTTVTEARGLPVGTKIWVLGVALNNPNAFGDSTVHMTDGTSFIRMSTVRPAPIVPGDTIALLGTRNTLDGQPTFQIVTLPPPLIRAVGPAPAPRTLTAPEAAAAVGGTLDAAFVKVFGATIVDTLTTIDGKQLTVQDAAGTVRVLLSNPINFGNLNQYNPPRRLDVAGLLVPDDVNPGTWILKPRARADVVILP